MNKIIIVSYDNIYMIFKLIIASLMPLFIVVLIKDNLEEKGFNILLILFSIILLIDFIVILILYKKFSKEKNLIIEENNIIINNTVVCRSQDIICIKRENIFKVSIKYLDNELDKTLYIIVSNKKLKNIKALLNIYD